MSAGCWTPNPADQISWQAPRAATAIDPNTVASPAQAHVLLTAAAATRPQLAAFFGCLYYGALRPEEATALRLADCHLPSHGWGTLTLSRTTPRTARAWTTTGSSHEQRDLKHRPQGSIRAVPIPPVLVTMLRHHHRSYGTAPDGRLFRGTRGGPLSESSYGRTWHTARTLALGPAAATPLARRPYDLRHAALSLWLNSGAAPAEIARRAGHSVTTLLAVYIHCIDGQDDITNRQIERALHPRSQARHHAASGPANRRYHPHPVRYLSVNGPHARRTATPASHGNLRPQLPAVTRSSPIPQLRARPIADSNAVSPRAGHLDLAHVWPTTASKRSAEPLLPSVRAADYIPRQRL